jgi:hypothetical protein
MLKCMRTSITLLTLLTGMVCVPVPAAQGRLSQSDQAGLTQAQASHLAGLALKCVAKEYPNKLDHVMNNSSEVKNPQALHPAFYGCFDWHSSVHGHWMLVRLLRLFPGMPEAENIRAALGRNLTAESLQAETAYLDQANRQSFERTYGWAWLLKLADELSDWKDPDGEHWSRNLQPLAKALAMRLESFLPKQTYPIRTGVHPNTAFALAFAIDYAKKVGDQQLQNLIAERSLKYFSGDKDYPAGWEPGGEDFFSPALLEADLMRRVLKPAEFRRWFYQFLPDIARGGPISLLSPAQVTDRTDPKLVHLDGLNLSRAWCMRSIAFALPPRDPARRILAEASLRHEKEALPHIASGDYAGEHWLASFAVYLLSTPAAAIEIR